MFVFEQQRILRCSNKNELFVADDIDEEKILYSDTRNYRKKINLDSVEDINIDCETIDNNMFEGIFELTSKNLKIHDSSEELSIKS